MPQVISRGVAMQRLRTVARKIDTKETIGQKRPSKHITFHIIRAHVFSWGRLF